MRRLTVGLALLAIAALPACAATLAGSGVALDVSEDAPVGITAIRHAPGEPSLFLDESTVEPTWTLLMETPAGEELAVDPVSLDLGGQVRVSDDAMIVRWDAFEAPGGTVKVACLFEAAPDQPLIYGRIRVDNQSDCLLMWVQFPRLTLIATPSPGAETELVFPRAFGRSWRDPFHAPGGYTVGTRDPIGHTKDMSFGTLYDDSGNGLYWAAYDPEGYLKRIILDNTQGEFIDCKLAEMPEAADVPGQDFVSPHPMVLGAYRGDWWDAAHMYRTWALQQKWSSKGLWELRTDVPDWVKHCNVWLRADTREDREIGRAHV